MEGTEDSILEARLANMERDHSRYVVNMSVFVGFLCWVVVVFSVAAVVLAAVVVFSPALLDTNQRVVFVTIFVVMYLALLLVLFLARKEPKALLIFLYLVNSLSFFIFGFVFWSVNKV